MPAGSCDVCSSPLPLYKQRYCSERCRRVSRSVAYRRSLVAEEPVQYGGGILEQIQQCLAALAESGHQTAYLLDRIERYQSGEWKPQDTTVNTDVGEGHPRWDRGISFGPERADDCG